MTASLSTGLGDTPYGVRPAAVASTGVSRHRPATPAPAPLRLLAQPEGLLHIHTAPFRGSFAAVLSQALRTAGLGSRVLVCQFLKGGVNQGVDAGPSLCGRLRWLRPAVEACLAEPAHCYDAAVADAVRQVWEFSREQLLSATVDLMVLDELGLAIDLGFIAADEVLAALEQRPAPMDVILTGPAMAPELMALADQVTQLRRGV
ncbi:cob(I)yrinic acid a,c-diamide adenosyltransferase [Cyanobium sp. CH-040]|uniref:cob(I)yrinic acid a,c-diamide adenosyltransferase n=1 Tax=Cyanobium sp. CH-040 TaxID=2823708 RepID=UPI0020CE01A4|nr:cob(I)yrinic acid a,c-diamide adenosyltransferase [Cyanobium sp. CH-040]MCP9927360.1 cob(I)yrinic acid a,c-diamide adenosyltransferase [Cyanobium sp. CH-040]